MFVLKMLSEGGEGPNTELVWLLYTGISLFFLVIVSGWISSARKKTQVQPEPTHAPAHHEEHEEAHAVKEASPKKDKGGKKK